MPARVLTVDDDEDVLNLLRLQLQQLHTVVRATNGRDAWSLIESEPPDVIVTDLVMPGLNGLDLTERIKSHETHKTIPVIVLTGATVDEEISPQVWKLGTMADAFMEKPVGAEELLAEIDRLLKKRAGWREPPPGKGYYD